MANVRHRRVWTDSRGVARARRECGQEMLGTGKCGQTAGVWQGCAESAAGSNMARARQEHGKSMASAWQEHGKSMAKFNRGFKT